MTADAVREALKVLIARYWDLAYAEGKEGRDTDTPDGAAAKTWLAIDEHITRLAALAGAAPDADELSRLYELAGYGGVSADAPERIILASSMYDGLKCCDKWCSVDRVVDDGQPMPESATVYIRADLAHAPAKAREDVLLPLLRDMWAETVSHAEMWGQRPDDALRDRYLAALATFAEGA